MSSKIQTLKNLLGTSDERVDVQFKGIVPTTSATIVPSGGTSVGLIATPRTNELLQLAETLGDIPTVYKQGVGIAQAEAADDLAELTDAEVASELAKGDKTTLSIFGYNKAYNEGLVARHYRIKAPEYAERLNNIASDLDNNPDIKTFNTALEKEVNLIRSDNAELFKINPYQAKANDKAFNAVMKDYIVKASENYLANHQEGVLLQSNTNFIEDLQIPNIDVGSVLTAYKFDLDNMPLDPVKKSELMIQQIEAGISVALENKNVDLANKLIEAGENFEVFKGAKLGAGKRKESFTNFRKTVAEYEEELEVDYTNDSKAFGIAMDGIRTAIDLGVSKDELDKRIDLLTKRYNLKGGDEFKKALEKGDFRSFQIAYLKFQAAQTTDYHRDLVASQIFKNVEFATTYAKAKPSAINSFTQEEMNELFNRREVFINGDPRRLTDPSLPKNIGDKTVHNQDPMYITMREKELQSLSWKTDEINSRYNDVIREFTAQISKNDSFKGTNLAADSYVAEYDIEFKNEMQRIASKVWKESNGSFELFNSRIREEASKLENNYKEEVEARRKLQSQLNLDLDELLQNRAEEEEKSLPTVEERETPTFFERITKKETPYKFKSFFDGTTEEEMLNDRNAIYAEIDDIDKRKRLLKYHVLLHGFPTMASLNKDLIEELEGVPFYFNSLGEEVLQHLNVASEFFKNDGFKNPKASDEAKENYKFWQSFGIDSLEDFETILSVQTDVINRKLRLLNTSPFRGGN